MHFRNGPQDCPTPSVSLILPLKLQNSHRPQSLFLITQCRAVQSPLSLNLLTPCPPYTCSFALPVSSPPHLIHFPSLPRTLHRRRPASPVDSSSSLTFFHPRLLLLIPSSLPVTSPARADAFKPRSLCTFLESALFSTFVSSSVGRAPSTTHSTLQPAVPGC